MAFGLLFSLVLALLGLVSVFIYIPYAASLLDQIALDVSELDCAREVEQTREIVASGTSADYQLTILAESQKTGIAPATPSYPWWTGSPAPRPAAEIFGDSGFAFGCKTIDLKVTTSTQCYVSLIVIYRRSLGHLMGQADHGFRTSKIRGISSSWHWHSLDQKDGSVRRLRVLALGSLVKCKSFDRSMRALGISIWPPTFAVRAPMFS